MELDQLKQRWQQTGSTGNTPPKNKFKMLLRRRNEDPISSMKRNFRRQIIVLVFVFCLFLHEMRNRQIFHNVFFDWYLVCGACLCVFFYLNLHLVRQMEKTDKSLTAHIKAQVALLEKRMRWQRIFPRVAIASLIILLEVLPFFSSESMLQKWHAVAPMIRIAVYTGLLLFQFYVGRLIARRRYGQHLDRLKKILNDAE
jgi:hypothetical protein